jgi:hypothetical protein
MHTRKVVPETVANKDMTSDQVSNVLLDMVEWSGLF